MGLSSEEGSPTETRPEGLERAERDLRRAMQAGIEVNMEGGSPEGMPWQRDLEAIEQALDQGDVETLRAYAEGRIKPGFPYRGSVELYVGIFDRYARDSGLRF